MSSLTVTERTKIEKLLGMSSGYVSNFSDTTFGHFFSDEVGVDIHDQKYQSSGSSKAKKLREFWRIEPDYLVGKSIIALIQHEEEQPNNFSAPDPVKQKLFDPCMIIATRLMSGNVNLDNLKETAVVFDAKHLAEQIRRIEQAIQTDPALAIGTAKELIETCCKTILAERGKPIAGMPAVFKGWSVILWISFRKMK